MYLLSKAVKWIQTKLWQSTLFVFYGIFLYHWGYETDIYEIILSRLSFCQCTHATYSSYASVSNMICPMKINHADTEKDTNVVWGALIIVDHSSLSGPNFVPWSSSRSFFSGAASHGNVSIRRWNTLYRPRKDRSSIALTGSRVHILLLFCAKFSQSISNGSLYLSSQPILYRAVIFDIEGYIRVISCCWFFSYMASVRFYRKNNDVIEIVESECPLHSCNVDIHSSVKNPWTIFRSKGMGMKWYSLWWDVNTVRSWFAPRISICYYLLSANNVDKISISPKNWMPVLNRQIAYMLYYVTT